MTLYCLLLLLSLQCFAAATRQQHTCVHGHRGNELTAGVQLGATSGGHSVKRDSEQPIRFSMYMDATITNDLPDSKRAMITEVIPSLLDFFSSIVSVIPTQDPILLDRSCVNGYYQPEEGSTVRRCVSSCFATTVCGTVAIPDNHLKRCIECNDSEQRPPECSAGDPSTDGAGVSNADYILYVSANQNECPGRSIVAFAGACQLESTLDRPITGYINFCPGNLEGKTRDFLFDVAKHELFHALSFSSSLIPFWRNSTGSPRTQRDSSGMPPFDNETRMYVPDTDTVTTVDYEDWRTISGSRPHTVTVLVTEAVLRVGREHFDCGELVGVELENQGGDGTALQHWEKRILGNEAMTGVFDFNPIFSALSLAVLEDSGWYTVDYSAAQSLLWGRGRGCGFIQQGCGDKLDTEPYCGSEESDLGCTLDGGSTAKCSLQELDNDVIADYRYLPDNMGGSLESADYCPYYREFKHASGRGGNCTDPLNQPNPSTSGRYPGEDVYGETYGPGSVCLRQGRPWQKSFSEGERIRTISVSTYGGGCYEVDCVADGGVRVLVRGFSYDCECAGQELLVDIVGCDATFKGSVICPPCSSLCGDLCPSPEPASCTGQVVELPQEVANCTTVTESPTDSTAPLGASLLSLSLAALLALLFH